MTQLLTGLPRALDLAQTDLPAIQARLETVHTEAWLPATPDHDRSTPPRPPNADPDFVAGERWDCGLGSYKARVAWERMAGHLDSAEMLSAAVLADFRGLQAPSVDLCRPGSLLDAQRVVRTLRARLRGLQRLHAGLAVNEPRARRLSDGLMGVRGHPGGTPLEHITLARWQTESIVAIVGTGKRPPVCRTCRNPNSIGLREKGWRCHMCAQRAYRLGARQRRAAVRGWQAKGAAS